MLGLPRLRYATTMLSVVVGPAGRVAQGCIRDEDLLECRVGRGALCSVGGLSGVRVVLAKARAVGADDLVVGSVRGHSQRGV